MGILDAENDSSEGSVFLPEAYGSRKGPIPISRGILNEKCAPGHFLPK